MELSIVTATVWQTAFFDAKCTQPEGFLPSACLVV